MKVQVQYLDLKDVDVFYMENSEGIRFRVTECKSTKQLLLTKMYDEDSMDVSIHSRVTNVVGIK